MLTVVCDTSLELWLETRRLTFYRIKLWQWTSKSTDLKTPLKAEEESPHAKPIDWWIFWDSEFLHSESQNWRTPSFMARLFRIHQSMDFAHSSEAVWQTLSPSGKTFCGMMRLKLSSAMFGANQTLFLSSSMAVAAPCYGAAFLAGASGKFVAIMVKMDRDKYRQNLFQSTRDLRSYSYSNRIMTQSPWQKLWKKV